MKKVGKYLLGFAIFLVVIQLWRPDHNVSKDRSNEIYKSFQLPSEVDATLQKACFDCHSYNTQYPWYADVQPVATWLSHHVNEGREELDFSEFSAYSPAKQYHKFEEIEEELEKGDMPLYAYTLMHREAVLTEGEKASVIEWTHNMRNLMKAKYPADSLVRPVKKGEHHEE
ncbi:MAG TPA: heme-binding domain-containing protein [Chitinophagales bacterium]